MYGHVQKQIVSKQPVRFMAENDISEYPCFELRDLVGRALQDFQNQIVYSSIAYTKHHLYKYLHQVC